MIESEINLKKVSLQENYISWLFNSVEPNLSGKILEVGAGLGVFTSKIESRGLEVVAIDNTLYGTNFSKVKILKKDITSKSLGLNSEFDTILCMSVLEHIKDDSLALNNMFSLLKNKGKIILMVPAFPSLYGKIDSANGHYRRYSAKGITSKLSKAGFSILSKKYMNFVGMLGWFFQNNVLNSKIHRDVDMKRFNYFCPVLEKLESGVKLPAGLNMLIVAEK